MQVLNSGKTSFKIEVPYRLYENGSASEKPLIVYLHGYGQNLRIFEKLTKPMTSLNAYHLYIQGPYPELSAPRNKREWGYAWYLYNGKQDTFVKSLEYSSEFLQEIVDSLIPFIRVSRLAILGYSMGGYLAGYFGLSRWKHVNDIIVINGRIKTEVFKTRWPSRKHINILALNGASDETVKPESQKEAITFLKEKGLNASFRLMEGGHGLSNVYLKESRKWLIENGYTPVPEKNDK